MKYRYLYKIRGKLSHKNKGLDALNNKLKEIGAGFTLKYGTDEPIDLMNFTMDVKINSGTGKPERMPDGWQEEALSVIKTQFERHQIILSDAYFELVDEYGTEEEEL